MIRIYSLVTRLYVIQDYCIVNVLHFMHLAVHQKSESKSRNRVPARAKLELSNVFYAFFIVKQKNVKYGVFYYFLAVSFNYAKAEDTISKIAKNQI